MNDILLNNLKSHIYELISYYYECNCTGGNLHIVLDDGNLEDANIWHCQEECEKQGDLLGGLIGLILRGYTEEEREAMYNDRWGRAEVLREVPIYLYGGNR